jgi:hypothetical protein
MLSVGSVFHYPLRDLLVERVVLNALTHRSEPDWHFRRSRSTCVGGSDSNNECYSSCHEEQ